MSLENSIPEFLFPRFKEVFLVLGAHLVHLWPQKVLILLTARVSVTASGVVHPKSGLGSSMLVWQALCLVSQKLPGVGDGLSIFLSPWAGFMEESWKVPHVSGSWAGRDGITSCGTHRDAPMPATVYSSSLSKRIPWLLCAHPLQTICWA